MGKKSVWQKVKDNWNSLSQYDRDWIKAVAIWTVDGALVGGMINGIAWRNKWKKDVNVAYSMGLVDGQMNAYRDLAQNPIRMMDAGMKALDKRGKVTHF